VTHPQAIATTAATLCAAAILQAAGYYVNDVAAIDAARARAYGRWLGARYRDAPNVIWVNGGDRIATGFEGVYRELARGLREGHGGAHLITYHPCGWRSSSQYFHDDDWLSSQHDRDLDRVGVDLPCGCRRFRVVAPQAGQREDVSGGEDRDVRGAGALGGRRAAARRR
jgi:hypothetical protein